MPPSPPRQTVATRSSPGDHGADSRCCQRSLVRVAVVAGTVHPVVNGVSNSVARVLEHLDRSGHQALVIAPAPGPASHRGVPVVRVRSFRPPMYRSMYIGRPDTPLVDALREFEPDVVH